VIVPENVVRSVQGPGRRLTGQGDHGAPGLLVSSTLPDSTDPVSLTSSADSMASSSALRTTCAVASCNEHLHLLLAAERGTAEVRGR